VIEARSVAGVLVGGATGATGFGFTGVTGVTAGATAASDLATGFEVGVAATAPPPVAFFSGLVPGAAFAVRSVNSIVSVAPAFTGTFFVTLSVSPPRSYSARNR
jgi:hypothetical protein